MQRKPYQRRLFTPLFPGIPKTTTEEGRREYNKLYARERRRLEKASKVRRCFNVS